MFENVDPSLPLIFIGVILVCVFGWGVYDWWRVNMRNSKPRIVCACEDH